MESSIQENNTNSICDIRIIFVLIVFIIFIFIFFKGNMVENMSPGVVTQMYAQDAQDTYLKGNIDQLATGNYLLNWNQPTRLATGSYFYTTGPNRGALLKNLCYKCKRGKCNCKKGPVYYPKAYTGNYFQFPTPDINYPLPYIVSNGSFVREGFENNSIPSNNIENFNSNQNSNIKLKLFYANWCGHCRDFKPIFEGKITDLLYDLPVKLETIDCDDNRELAEKYNISSFPTLILEINDIPIEYDKKKRREPELILEFVKKNIGM
jgi:thiol-disulfide isomerase/thioredoxin